MTKQIALYIGIVFLLLASVLLLLGNIFDDDFYLFGLMLLFAGIIWTILGCGYKLYFGISLLVIGIVVVIFENISYNDFYLFFGLVLLFGGFIASLLGYVEKYGGKRDFSKSDLKKAELWKRLITEEPAYNIAKEYYNSEKIPPIATLQTAASLIRELGESEVELAKHLTSKQTINSRISPIEAIFKFNFVDQVYYCDNARFVSSIKYKNTIPSVEGTLILHKGFLFFFEKKEESLNNKPDPLEAGVSFLDFILPGASKILKLINLFGEFGGKCSIVFDEAGINNLMIRHSYENSFVIPLETIRSVSTTKRGFVVVSEKTIKKNITYHFESEYLLFSSNEWTKSWINILQLACIMNGNLLK